MNASRPSTSARPVRTVAPVSPLALGAAVTGVLAASSAWAHPGHVGSDAFFPKTSGGSLNAGADADIRIWQGLFVQVGAEYLRTFLSFQKNPAVVYTATGGVDQGWGIHARAGWAM